MCCHSVTHTRMAAWLWSQSYKFKGPVCGGRCTCPGDQRVRVPSEPGEVNLWLVLSGRIHWDIEVRYPVGDMNLCVCACTCTRVHVWA